MLKKIMDCSIEQVRNYIEDKFIPLGYDITDVWIDKNYNVGVEYYTKRRDYRIIEMSHDKRIRVDEPDIKFAKARRNKLRKEKRNVN